MSDHGNDSDSDGLFDSISLDFGVVVLTEDDYTLTVDIEGPAGERITTVSAEVPPGVGTITATVPIGTSVLRRDGISGPYTVAAAVLAASGDYWEGLVVDSVDAPHVSHPYELSQFEPLAVDFNGLYEDSAYDDDADGMYEALRLTVGVTTAVPATYIFEVSLVAGDGRRVAMAREVLSLEEQDTVVVLSVPGLALYQARVDGPYVISTVIRNPAGKVYARAVDAYSTAAYSFASFGDSALSPSIEILSDEALDTWPTPGDRPPVQYDYLRVNVRVDNARSLSTDRLEISAFIQASAEVTKVQQTVDLATADIVADPVVHIDFPGASVRDAGDGPYDVTAWMLAPGGEQVDLATRAYTTGPYEADMFAPALVVLSGFLDAVPHDDDADGKYEWLEFRVGVIASVPGQVGAQAEAVAHAGTGAGEIIDYVSGGYYPATIASSGEEVVLSLRLEGAAIAEGHYDGPYTLRSLQVMHALDYRQDVWLDEAYVTGAYSWSQFE